MPIKVPQHIIDNDMLVYGQCCIETDQLGNERRVDPAHLRIMRTTTKKSRRDYNPFGAALDAIEKKRIFLQGEFQELTVDEYWQMLGCGEHNVIAASVWQMLHHHSFMLVRRVPVDYHNMVDHKPSLEPMPIKLKIDPEKMEEFRKKWGEIMNQTAFPVYKEPETEPLVFQDRGKTLKVEDIEKAAKAIEDAREQRFDINHPIKRDRHLTEQVQDMMDKEMEKIDEKEKLELRTLDYRDADKQLWERLMQNENIKKAAEPVCTCRDDDKYARRLCPVCDKERYDEMLKVDVAVTKEIFKDKPEDIISPEDFFKSLKGDI